MAASSPEKPRRLRAYDDEDIVRYAMGMDVPIVGLVRNRDEYREMREIALIYGMTLGLSGKLAHPAPSAPAPETLPAAPTAPAPPAAPAPTPEVRIRVRGKPRAAPKST